MKLLCVVFAVVLAGTALLAEARLPASVISAMSDEVGWVAVSDVSDLTGALTRRGKNAGMWSVGVKYIVPPDSLHDFADRWEKLEDKATDESGNLHFSLKKTLNDNFMFLGMEEWKSHEDWMDHLEHGHAREWRKWLAENKVMYFVKPLIKVTDDMFKSSDNLGRKRRSERAGLAFRFRVQPGKYHDFVSAWTDVAKSTSREDGNEVYTLRKSLLDNTDLYATGQWQSWEDVWDHIESDHFQDLKDFAAEHDVFWSMSPVMDSSDHWD